MSGQWEVVGKKKDRGSNTKLPVPKSNKQESNKVKKNNALNGVKIEEVLPKSQVQSIYANHKIKENKKAQEKPLEKQKNESKKPEKKANKPQEPSKPKPPKSIESALNLINLEDFKTLYEKSKLTYPDAPIVWLKELVQFLNLKIPIDIQDPVFSSKPQTYPLSIVPEGIRSVIEKSVKEAGRNNAQLYFDIALTSMVTDMSKGLPAVGYKFFLQHIALSEPKLVVDNIKKHVTLRNSYQNRANIGLSILWAVGHVGIKDLQSGLTVFEELMVPLLEMKNYSQYIAKYLLDLISSNLSDDSLSKEQYLLILDTVFSNKKNCPPEIQRDLVKNSANLKTTLLRNKEKPHSYVEMFLKKLPTVSDKTYQRCLCDVLLDIFNKDQSTLANWNKFYAKNLASSGVLLNYIANNYKTLQKFIGSSAFKNFLINLNEVNEELLGKKRKDDGLRECIAAIKKINESATKKEKKGSFIGSLIKFLFIVGSLGVLVETIYKVQQGKPEDSSFRKINNGIVCGVTWANNRIEMNFPEQHKIVAKISEPYIELGRDLGKVAANTFFNIKESLDPYVKEKYLLFLKTVDTYAPGLLDKCKHIFNNMCTTTAIYYNKGTLYLQKEVFVGQLSPENMQRVVIEAYNTTSVKATEYYHWLYEKVQTAIK